MPIASEQGAEPETAGFVLAGGRSSRMGQDKSLVLFNGQPMIAYSLAALGQAALPASISGGQPALAAFAPLITDGQSGLGPLAGICSALASTLVRRAVFLSVDAPLLPAALLGLLVSHAAITGALITVASVNGFAQTFPAVLDRAALPALARELASGRLGCFRAFRAAADSRKETVAVLPVELLVQAGQIAHPLGLPAAWWFLNANTPEELARAQILARPAPRPPGPDFLSGSRQAKHRVS
jgi:molybdopterin-guanine dinucleotide biosynthesis protein A